MLQRPGFHARCIHLAAYILSQLLARCLTQTMPMFSERCSRAADVCRWLAWAQHVCPTTLPGKRNATAHPPIVVRPCYRPSDNVPVSVNAHLFIINLPARRSLPTACPHHTRLEIRPNTNAPSIPPINPTHNMEAATHVPIHAMSW